MAQMWVGGHLVLCIAKNDKHPEYKRWSVEQKKKRLMSAAAAKKMCWFIFSSMHDLSRQFVCA